jgi:hypothetical protein
MRRNNSQKIDRLFVCSNSRSSKLRRGAVLHPRQPQANTGSRVLIPHWALSSADQLRAVESLRILRVPKCMGTDIISYADSPRHDHQDKAKEVLELATRDLDKMMAQRAEIARQIRRLRKLILALAASFEQCVVPERLQQRRLRRLPPRDRELTEACRVALRQAEIPMTLEQIRDRLRFQSLEFEKHKDPTASVARALRRLVRLGEARTAIGAHGRHIWITPATENPSPTPESQPAKLTAN